MTVTHAGHNLFMVDPAVAEVIQAFMRGEVVGDTTITVPLPDFVRD